MDRNSGSPDLLPCRWAALLHLLWVGLVAMVWRRRRVPGFPRVMGTYGAQSQLLPCIVAMRLRS